ncbi:hypothetical protein ARMSODRAFT_1006694 [Armillaria solidipes]|uniref:Fungal STAND N-terminal Goodbye domain-containing protein n=1 Tax=Armillaria solidipes TaxID=1076256 RepID=A0A2H3BN85_9AGAR|nr:hypothetical protein ARMSODRAFT_1006694 [Armillaria solidipes]
MPALNACLKVANIAEASGVPYVENVAKVAVVVFKLLEQKGKNKKSAEELCESIADTIVVIDTLVHMQGERGTSCYIDICGEMERYLESMAQDIKDIKLKHRGLKGVFCVDEFRDAIQAYRRRVDDLKMDFVIHSVGDCHLEVTQMHSLLKNAVAQAVVRYPEEFVFRISKKSAAITAFFFFTPANQHQE